MMRGGGPPFVGKRCGLPLALPLHAKKLCPDLPLSRRFGHRVLVWKTGKKPSRFCRSTSAAGVGYALRYREIPADKRYGKADMAVMVMSAFFAGSIPSAEALPRYGVSSAPATTKRCRGTGKDSFPGPAERTCCRFQPEPSLAWAFWGKGDQGEPSARRVPPDTGPQDVCRDGEEDPSLHRRLRHRQQGQWPPVSHCFFRSRFPGYRRPGPRPHRRRGRPWRNDGYGAA